MKTFFLHVRERRRPRAVDVSKLIVIAEDSVKALEIAKNHYGPNCCGWHPSAEFILVKEIDPNTAFMV